MAKTVSISLNKFTASVQAAVKSAVAKHPKFNVPTPHGVSVSYLIRGIPVPDEILAKVTLAEPMLPKVLEPDTSDLQPVQKQADELARRAVRWDPNIDSTMLMLQALAETGSEFSARKARSAREPFYRARRLVLALDRLANALNQHRATPLKIDDQLNLLRQEVGPTGNFDAARFADHLRALRAKL